MNALLAFLQSAVFPDQVTQRLAWVLVHFVWQGAAVAVLLALTLWLGRVRRPSTRYAFGLVALLAMVACPVVTFGLIRPELRAGATVTESLDQTKVAIIAPRDEPIENGRPMTEGSSRGAMMAALKDNPQRDSMGFVTEVLGLEILEPQPPLANATDAASQWPVSSIVAFAHDAAPARASWSRVQPWIVSGWLLGVALLSLRLLLGWLGVWRLRRRVEPVPEWLAERAQHLAATLRVARPLIHLSHRVTEAVAVGFLKPMILLPVAWVTELPPDMIEAVIAHELAHIRRGDLWVNLVQRLVETLLFYHPAVWWLSRRLRIERELCCDELVVRTLHNPLRYAETLEHVGRLSLADSRAISYQRLDARTTLTVSIGSPRNILLNRIRAILTPPQQDRSTSAWLAGLIPLAIACLVGWSLISRNTAPASDEPKPSKPPESASIAAVVEPPAPSNDIRPGNLVEAAGTYRGRIVTDDGSLLPLDLKLMRRVSSEQTRETPVDPNGEFSFGADPSHGSVRFSMTATGFAPFDSSWLKLDQPLTLTLSRGAMVKLRLVPPAGSGPATGTAALIVPWWDEDEQGTFPVDANGVVTITRCPKATVKIDVLVPSFEEVRIHRWVRGDVTLEVPLQPAKPTRLRIVSAKDGSPIAGAKVRLFSRTRAGSFLTPFQRYGDGPVWGESNVDGRVELTTLRAVDPVPTNDPGAAVYAFRIDATNHAPCYIGDVRAGGDLGEIQVGGSLEVRGEVVRDPANPERISLQVRQPTVAQGGKDGRGGWKNIEPTEDAGKLTFHLTGLQAGPFDMFIVYSDASEPPNSLRGTIKQLQFHGLLTGSSSNLSITRESVVPGDKRLTARRASLFPIDDHPPSNVPGNVSKLLVAGWHTAEEADGKTVVQENKPTLQPLFVWSSTSPMQHSMGRVDWRVFVLQDGTVFIPGGMNHEAGTHHKLPAAELQELKNLLEKHRDLFGQQVPKELPQFAGWRNGHENLSYTKDGETKAFVKWYGLEQPPLVGDFDPAGSHKAITEFISRLMTDAACGGRQAKAKYRELANKALTAVLPKATPFNEAIWTNTVNGTDGTRTIRFANTNERTEVTLIHSAFGEVYVERIEQFDKRIALDAPLPALHGKADTLIVRDQETRAEQQRVTDLDPEEWKQAEAQFGLLMDRVPLREREMPLCWRMLGWAEAQPFAELQRRTESDASPEDLYAQPDKSRGRPVRLRLHIRRLLEWEPPENPLGVKRMYEAWGSAPDTAIVPCVVVFTELPAGMKVGEDVRIDGDFAGYFLKVMSYSAQDGKKRGVPLLVGRLQHRAEQETAPEKPPGEEALDPDRARRTNAVERGVQFLKSRQRDDDGTWFEDGSKVEGATALATVALLQAGVKADEAVIQKALPALRKIEPKMIYVVALQTMALCAASPKDDAELIRRNVAWIENAQVKEGNATGGWSYVGTPIAGRADGSCSRFAILGLDAAKRAKFEVRAETWQRVATYWLKSQQENGGWGYTAGASPSFSMSLAGVAGLATAHRHLPKDDQAAAREAALLKPHELIAKGITAFVANEVSTPPQAFRFYSCQGLERAGHLTNTVRFGDVDWKSVVTKRLLDEQRDNGAWVQQNSAENELLASSFALMFLSGRSEDRGDGKADGTAKPGAPKPKAGDLRSETPRGQETPVEPGRLGGRVVDADGIPVAGAEVSLFVTEDRRNESPPVLALKTKVDADGTFRLTVPQTAVHAAVWVAVPGKGVGVRPVSMRGPPANADGLPDKTVPADSPDQFVIRLVQGSSRMRVVDPRRKPLGGAKVLVRQVVAYRSPYDVVKQAKLLAKDRGLPEEAMLGILMEHRDHLEPVPREFQHLFAGGSDAQGNVTLNGVSLGDVALLEVETESFGRQFVSRNDVTLEQDGRDRIEKSNDAADGPFEVWLSQVGRVEGRVEVDERAAATGFRAEGLRLTWRTEISHRLVKLEAGPSANTHGRAEVDVDASGRFVIPAIASGGLILDEPLRSDSPVKVVLLNRNHVTPGKTTEVTVSAIKGALGRGRVRLRDTGAPVASASVRLLQYVGSGSHIERLQFVTTDDNGRFQAYLLPGFVEYRTDSIIEGYAAVHTWEHRHVRAAHGLHHPILDDVDGVELPSFDLEPTRSRTVTVLDEKGQPVGAVWNIEGYPGESPFASAHGSTNERGEVTLAFPVSYPPTAFAAQLDPTKVVQKRFDDRRHELKVVRDEPLVLQFTGKFWQHRPAVVVSKSSLPRKSPDELKAARQQRLAANDRETAKKLVGNWKLSLPSGFVHSITLAQRADGCLILDSKKPINSRGAYAFAKNGLELIEPVDKGIDDFIWQLDDRGSFKLVHEQHRVGGHYVGATLERIAEVK